MSDSLSQVLRPSRGRPTKVTLTETCGWTRPHMPPITHCLPLLKRLVHRSERPSHHIVSAFLLLLVLLATPVTPTSDTPSSALASLTTPSPSSIPQSTSKTFISKCCPLESNLFRNLSTGLFSCEKPDPLNTTTTPPTLNDGRDSMRVVDLLSRGFPKWMYPEMAVVDAEGKEQKVLQFFEANPDLLVHFDRNPQCPDSQIVSAVRDPLRLHANGSLQLHLVAWGGAGDALLRPDDFCVDGLRTKSGGLHAALLACPCRRVSCVRKCCNDKRLLHLSVSRAVEVFCEEPPPTSSVDGAPTTPWRPLFHNEDLEPLDNTETPTHHLVLNSLRFLTCPQGLKQILLHDGYNVTGVPPRLRVMRNGSAVLEGYDHVKRLDNSLWCSDASVPSAGEENRALARAHNALLCVPPSSAVDREAAPDAVRVAYASLFLVGALFLLLTLAVYIVLPELRAPPHSKALCCHCAALLISTTTDSIGKLLPYIPEASCIPIALIIQYFLLASFFWLNVLCIDISWTFSGFRGLLGSLVDSSRKKFVYYSLYAWGSPLIITSVTAILQEASDAKSLPTGILAPGIGKTACWFHGAEAVWAFLYGPMLALLVVNAALFGFTALQLARAHRDGAELNRGDSVRHDRSSRLSTEKRKMILYSKLFLLMGVTWLMEVVSWAVAPEADALWFVPDAVNMLRGVFIFVIFCCKRTVVRLLHKRLDAWGVRCGCLGRLAHVERSATHRSGLSTRTSSMLPLGSLPAPALADAVKGASGKGEDPADVTAANGVTAREADSRKGSLVSITV